MHIAPLLSIDPHPLAGDINPALDRLEALTELLVTRPYALVGLHVSAHVLSRVAEQRPELAARLPDLPVEWVCTGWGEPDLTLLPERVIQEAISHEAETLERLGLQAGPFWVRRQWNPRLPLLLSDAGVTLLLLDATLAEPACPGVVSHLDRVLPALVVTPLPDPPLPPPPGSDEVRVWEIGPEDLADLVSEIVATPECDLTTPLRFIADHPVQGRLSVRDTPGEERPTTLYRKLVRLATRLPERVSTDALEALLTASHRGALQPGAPPELRHAAHASLIAARRSIERDRRRGDDWARISRLDWDADGVDEVQIEQAELSLVLDPADGGALRVLDDKPRAWPVGHLPGEEVSRLCILVPPEGPAEGIPLSLEVERAEESRDQVSVTMRVTKPDLQLHCQLTARRRTLTLAYETSGLPAGRLGPQLCLALGPTLLRVDGSEWMNIEGPTTVSGHRFRLAGPEHQILITSMVPTDLFLRPGGDSEVRGVVLWANWTSSGASSHTLTISLAPDPVALPAS